VNVVLKRLNICLFESEDPKVTNNAIKFGKKLGFDLLNSQQVLNSIHLLEREVQG
jgi:hypothetical protein